MKPLTEHARTLINHLYKPPTFAHRLLGKSGLDLSCVRELGLCGEPAVIPHLTPALLLAAGRELDTVAQALAMLLSRTSPEDLAYLEEPIRRSWAYVKYGEQGHRLDPRELARWMEPGKPGGTLLGLVSFYPDGHIREEAVRRMALIADGSELSYLLLRLSDWVSPVRHAAQQAVRERIRPEYAEHFVQNLALPMRLHQTERADRGLLAQISDLLRSPAARPAMIAAMDHPASRIRRASYDILASGEPADLHPVLLAAQQVQDPIIRLRSLQRAVTILGHDQVLTVAERGCADAFAAIRCEALAVLATAFPERAVEKLQAALLDRSPSVRGTARFHLRKRGPVDFAQFYRNAMEAPAAPGRLAASVAGLSETGESTDVDLLVPYLSNPSVSVRRAAVQGVMKLGGERSAGLVLERVLDAAPGVSTAARRALQACAEPQGASALWTRFSASGLTHVRRNLLRMIAGQSKWDSISYLVRAAGDPDEGIASLALAYIGRWNAGFNSRQTGASSEQVVRLRDALTQCGDVLDAENRALLELAVRGFSV